MGIRARGARSLRQFTLGLLATSVLAVAGCESRNNARVISAAEFRTPILRSIQVLSNKLDLLKAIFPQVLDSELLNQRARARPLGKAGAKDLLVYESDSGALLSIDAHTALRKAPVTLHYTQRGLETELFTQGVISQDPAISTETVGDATSVGVRPIALRSPGFEGWMLALESSSRSLVAFKKLESFRPADPPDDPDGPNFGLGNGLVMSVVISGLEMQRQIDEQTPRVSRIFELANGKLLVSFLGTVRSLHLLELTLEPAEYDFDLSSADDAPMEIMVPKGEFRLVDDVPFLTFQHIQETVTQNKEIEVDGFQPILVPKDAAAFCGGVGLPEDGRALIYDGGSASFLQVWEELDAAQPRAGLGQVLRALTTNDLLDSLIQAPPYFMSEAIYLPDCRPIWIFEEFTNTMLQADFQTIVAGGSERIAFSLSVKVPPVSFLLRRDPAVVGGGDVIPSGEETVLVAGDSGVEGSHLYFDQGRDQLLAIHFDTGNVVIVAKRADFEAATLRPLADVTWLEAIGSEDAESEIVRAFDSESTSLVDVRLGYTTLPVEDRDNTN